MKTNILCLATLWLVTLAAAGDPAPFIEGVEPYQVFPRQGKAGDISFRAKGPGTLTAELFRSGEDKPLLHREWTIAAEGFAPLTLGEVPVGGEYTLRFRLGDQQAEFRHILVGDIWLIGGQSNAVGIPHVPEKPSPGVHYLRDNHWGVGVDPLFPPIFPLPPGETYVAAWRRAAQRYYEQTGVPVGLMGWAFGGVVMSRFWDADIKEMPDFKPLVTAHGRGATAFLWYQGESDANLQGIPVYRDRLTAMASAIRRYAANSNLVMLVVQLSYVMDPPGKETPHTGRLREQQRQFCAADARAVLIPTLPYSHYDAVHLDYEGFMALGDRIGECLAEVNRNGRVTWQGPRLVSAKFADASRRKVRVAFDSAAGLKLLEAPPGAGDFGKGHQPQLDWLVTDNQHQGYAEILSAKIENGQVLLDVGGATIDTGATRVGGDGVRAPLTRSGFLRPRNMVVEGLEVLLELSEPAQAGAKVSYGLMSNSLCTLADDRNLAAATFADIPIAEP